MLMIHYCMAGNIFKRWMLEIYYGFFLIIILSVHILIWYLDIDICPRIVLLIMFAFFLIGYFLLKKYKKKNKK